MAQRFLQIAVVYLFAGAALGIAMGVGENFTLSSTHSHLLLLTGHAGLVPVVASSAMVVLVGLALFAINVLRHVKAA